MCRRPVPLPWVASRYALARIGMELRFSTIAWIRPSPFWSSAFVTTNFMTSQLLLIEIQLIRNGDRSQDLVENSVIPLICKAFYRFPSVSAVTPARGQKVLGESPRRRARL